MINVAVIPARGGSKRIPGKNIKYLADTFHMNIEEVDIGAGFRRAGSKLGYVHLVDSNRQLPGQGHLPMREVLRSLADIGYDGCLSFECLPSPDGESSLERALSFVRESLLQ